MNEWLLYEERELYGWFVIFDYVFQRGQVGTSQGIKFIVHTSESGHNKPHLHAQYQGNDVVLEIPSGEVIQGSISRKKQKAASEWVVEHESYLKNRWNELTQGVVVFG